MPLPSTMTPIATQTLNSAAGTVTFSSIPQIYTDLVLVSIFGPTAGDDLYLQFNGDAGANYSTTWLGGNGTTATSGRKTGDNGIQPRTPANQPSTVTTIYNTSIMNYSNSTTYKTALGRYNYASGFTEADVGLWRNTAAITSLTFKCIASTFVAGSTFTLYGIKAA
jgi:hypothetical protein